ncbi:MAG: hypothetical protein J1E36_07755 [Eubacterium sp.]|nr:hypothetical protein [Eubacterium sp.]
MQIFSTRGRITTDNNKTNLIHKFDVPKGLTALRIKYSYSPKILQDRERAVSIIKECFDKYGEELIGRPADYLPVKNLITLSVDGCGVYRGAAHRQDDIQEHIISAGFTSPGFIKGTIDEGEWDIVLNVHSVSCDVEYTIEVEGEVE